MNPSPTSRYAKGIPLWIWAVGWMGAAVVLVLVLRSAGLSEVREALRGVHLGWITMSVVANLLILPFWTGAWLTMLPRDTRVGLWRMGEIVAMTAMAQNTLPVPLGHAGSAVALSRHGGIRSTGVASILATQEVTEGAAKLSVLLLAGALAPLPAWMRSGAIGLALGAGALAVLLFFTARLLQEPEGPLPGRLEAENGVGGPTVAREPPRAVRQWIHAFAERLEVMREGRRFLAALAFLLAMKAAEGGAIYCAQVAFGVHLPVGALPGVLGGVMLASLVPFAPASLGTYEAAVYFVYLQLGVEPGPAMAMALVQHLSLWGALVGAGFLVLTLRLAAGTWPQSYPIRALRALAFWSHYLLFSGVVGLLALRKHWARKGEESSP